MIPGMQLIPYGFFYKERISGFGGKCNIRQGISKNKDFLEEGIPSTDNKQE